MVKRLAIFIIILVIIIPVLFFSFQYLSRAASVKANITVDVKKTSGPFPDRWKALAQGGEESGVRMLENVVFQVSAIYPRYIRIDHIYDFYDVVSRSSTGNLSFNFSKLDQTVCDIYHTGAKPFFSLGYMPQTMSDDDTLIGKPKNWNEWTFLVQKTVEHYSGKDIVLPCGALDNFWKTDIYYEVWNEPDLESFGKWRYSGEKSYSDLYFYSVKGAQQAQNSLPFKIGGPATTALYKNWIQKFLDFVATNNLRIDFLSWHHYSKKTDDFTDDIIKLHRWLGESPKYDRYENLPNIISEWGYDSEKNIIADTDVGAAHTVASLRNLIDARFEMAFLFEIKDEEEINNIKTACQITDQCLEEIVKTIKIGSSEKEIAFRIEFWLKKNNHDLSFYPIVAVDKNSAIPHYDTQNGTNEKIKNNSVILIDFGTKFQDYHSDMTRMIFFGRPTEEIINTYTALLNAQEKTIKSSFAKASEDKQYITGKDVDLYCRQQLTIINQQLTYSHSTGHGVGLQIHESPKISFTSTDTLLPNQVITIEPGVYINNKWGMRIEDTVLLKGDGVEILTKFSKQLLIIG